MTLKFANILSSKKIWCANEVFQIILLQRQKNSSRQMRQISRRMDMIHPTVGWGRGERETHKDAHGSWILWSVSCVHSKTMHSLSCITSWLPHITLCYIDSRLGNLRTATTTGSELLCTAQARPVNFVFVVSSTTPNKVESRRPESTSFGRYKSTVLSDFWSHYVFLSS